MLGSIIQWIKRRKVVVLVLVFSFIVSGLIINALELTTIPLYFISKKWFRIINAKIVYLHWCVIPWTLERWANCNIEMYSDAIPDVLKVANTEHAIVVMNHPGDLDWMLGWVVINRMGMLGGTKAIMKDVARFLPGIGWTFLFMEYPLLKRNWAQDRQALVAACRNLRDYPVNMLLCLFAEGTRFTKEKHKMSMDFARSRGYPVLRHHLFPRTKGFCLLMKELRETVPAIYDVTIVSREDDPVLLDIINAKPSSADVCVRRFPTADIPETDEGISEWLINLYKEKDDLVDHHIKHKRFPDSVQKVTLPRSYWPDLIVGLWICLLGVPAVLTAFYLAWVGAWLTLGLILAAVFVADQLFQYIANETDTKKSGSTYGLQTPSTASSTKTLSQTARDTGETTPTDTETTPTDNEPRETKKVQ
jgi:lysophosphatidic acid acyltransferase/lysophosphatidylinositol acyltransferase